MKGTLQNESAKSAERAAGRFVAPEVNIFEDKDGYTIEAEMPGVTKEGLEITLEGNEISIIGRRSVEVVSGEPLVQERAKADYRRAFELDPAIDASRIGATISQGILTLVLPKSEEVKPRKIAVGD